MKSELKLASVPGGWPTDAPPRSACFSLTPEGESGDSYENLSSYFRRLSACHGVFPYTFAFRIRSLFIDQEACTPDLSRYNVIMNGLTGGAAAWVNILERLTMRTDLELRTLLPLRGMVARSKLLSQKERFCPACYRDDEILNRPKYNRLLWAVDCVEACPLHCTVLQTAPAAPSRMPFTFGLPGVSRLDGTSLANCKAQQASEIQIRTARAIADLLDDVHHDPVAFENKKPISTFLYQAADTFFESSIFKMAHRLHLNYANIYIWLNERSRPSLPNLAYISLSFNCKISDILLGKQLSLNEFNEISGVKRGNSHRHLSKIESPAALLADLTRLESSGVVRSLSQTCKLLDVNANRLRRLAPDIVARIVQASREERHRQKIEREESNLNTYCQCFQELLMEDITPTKHKVSERASLKIGRKIGWLEATKFHAIALSLSKLPATALKGVSRLPPELNRDTPNPTNSRRKRH